MALEICFAFVIIVSAFLALFYLVSIYNGLVVLRNNIDKAWANIDVMLKQRSDLIPQRIPSSLIQGKGNVEVWMFLPAQIHFTDSYETRDSKNGESTVTEAKRKTVQDLQHGASKTRQLMNVPV